MRPPSTEGGSIDSGAAVSGAGRDAVSLTLGGKGFGLSEMEDEDVIGDEPGVVDKIR